MSSMTHPKAKALLTAFLHDDFDFSEVCLTPCFNTLFMLTSTV